MSSPHPPERDNPASGPETQRRTIAAQAAERPCSYRLLRYAAIPPSVSGYSDCSNRRNAVSYARRVLSAIDARTKSADALGASPGDMAVFLVWFENTWEMGRQFVSGIARRTASTLSWLRHGSLHTKDNTEILKN